MNIAARFPDTARSRRLAFEEAFDLARIEEQRARSAKDDLAKRIYRKDLPADIGRLLDRAVADLNDAIQKKRKLLDILLDTRDDLRTESDVTYEMKRAVRDLTTSEDDADPDAEHRQSASDVLYGVRRI